MLVQPKLLTVILASDDLAKTYTTIHAVQKLRYRNHEIVCVVPYSRHTLRQRLMRDFNWMPLISLPYASVSSLLQSAVQYGKDSHVDAFCFIQAGSTMDVSFLHQMTHYLHSEPKTQAFIPRIARTDGSGLVLGGVKTGRWPHQLKSLALDTEPLPVLMPKSRFVGGALLIRSAAAGKIPLNDSADDLALLYWTDRLATSAFSCVTVPDVQIIYDGPLFSDFLERSVPASWYSDALRYITTHGTWYDKLRFWISYAWKTDRSEDTFLASHARSTDRSL